MTKKEMCERVTNWNRSIGKLEERKINLERELEGLNYKYGTRVKYASIDCNLSGLIGTDYEIDAFIIYREIVKIDDKKRSFI